MVVVLAVMITTTLIMILEYDSSGKSLTVTVVVIRLE